MKTPEEALSDLEKELTNIEENVSSPPSPDEDFLQLNLEEDVANQTPRPQFIRVNPKRKVKSSTPSSDATSSTSKSEPLVPGEIILDVVVRPGLAKPDGWDTYYLGDARKLDLNSSPATMGMPTTRMGFYDVTTGKTSVVCPMCFQRFTTTTVLESGHLEPGGPCENYRKKLDTQRFPKKSKGKGKVKEVDEDPQVCEAAEYHGMNLGGAQMGVGEGHQGLDGGAGIQNNHGVYPMGSGVGYQGFGYQGFEGGAGYGTIEGNQPSEGAVGIRNNGERHQVESGEGNQVDGEETYLGSPMEEVFPGYQKFVGGRPEYLGDDLGPAPWNPPEDPPFQLPPRDDGSRIVEGPEAMRYFWAYQGFEGYPGFEGRWWTLSPQLQEEEQVLQPFE